MKPAAGSGGAAGNVCVTGATSQLGVFLLPRLHAAGFRVVAVSRSAPHPPAAAAGGVIWARPETVTADSAPPVFGGPLSHLVSCGPLALARDIVLRGGALRRVVAFSSSSVVSKAASPNAAERRQMAALARQEEELAAACAAGNLPLLLLRPTLIYGCGHDRNVSLLAGFARRFGVIPLAGAAGGLRQPVHADDLAELAVRALTAPAPLAMTSAACGGSTLTYRAMAERVAAAVPRGVRLVTLPGGLLAAALWSMSRLPGWRGLSTEMARRQSRDLVFDDSALRDALGWSPRRFEPSAADFGVPGYARALQLQTHRS